MPETWQGDLEDHSDLLPIRRVDTIPHTELQNLGLLQDPPCQALSDLPKRLGEYGSFHYLGVSPYRW